MATINWPASARGSVRPYGFAGEHTVSGTDSAYIGVPSDVNSIGLTVHTVTTGYFLEGSQSPIATIEAGNGVFADLIGNGVAAQTTAKQIEVPGAFSVIRLRGSAGGSAATVSFEMRRS